MGIGILYVDDHEVFHECIQHLFNTREDMQILAVANNGQAALRLTRELQPDVVVMDVRLPTLNGIEATRRILQIHPGARVVGLSGYADRKTVVAMLKAGARGFVVKDAAFTELLQAIEAVVAGKRYLSSAVTDIMVDEVLGADGEEPAPSGSELTPRERQVLQMVAEGMSSRAIADILFVSPKTIETHRARLMKKLQLTSLADLVKYALREGITTL